MNNRTKIISSILFWILVLLVSIFLLNTFSKSTFDWTFSFNNNDDRILIQQQTITEPIESLRVDWTVGSVTIEGTNKSSIEIKEYANKELSEREKASIDVTNTRISINSSINSSISFLFWQAPINHLHVMVPYDMLQELKVYQTSGLMIIEELSSESIYTNLTSGLATYKKLTSKSLITDMTSGNLKFDDVESDVFLVNMTSGVVNAKQMSVDESILSMTSGLLNIEFVNTPPSMIDGKINAGSATIDLPEDSDFTLTSSITSGNLNANFSHTTDGNKKTHKSGRDSYTLEITSGNVTVNIP